MVSFFIFLGFNIGVLLLVRYFFRKKYSILKQATICSFLFYLSILVLAFGTSIYLKNQLDQYDLDKNGFFTREEQTEAQQKAMREVTSDLGRNLAPILGIFYSGIYFLFIFLGLFFYNSIKILIEKYYTKYQQSL